MEARFQRQHELIKATGDAPITPGDIEEALSSAGVRQGETLMLHASLSRIGWIVGGVQTLIDSILSRLGPRGLLAMPAHSNDLSDPANWENPPVPETWVRVIRDHMPPYDPGRSPALRLGMAAEYFRSLPGVVRSAHPHYSLAALGPEAEDLTANHALDFSMSDSSPYGRLYAKNSRILLFGVGYENCTLLHVAEYLAHWPGKQEEAYRAPVERRGGKTVWKEYRDFNFDTDDFPEIGKAFEAAHPQAFARVKLGLGEFLLIESRMLVDFAVTWMESHRRDEGNPSG
jgi:aminoglycoside 3-N-acetyltransferase